MQCGPLRKRITIEQPNLAAPNAFGERTSAWTIWAQTWAEIKPISGIEAEFAKSFAATVSHRIVMRYLAGVQPTYRIRYGTRVFAINGVIDVDERHFETLVFATEVLAAQTTSSPNGYDVMQEGFYDVLPE